MHDFKLERQTIISDWSNRYNLLHRELELMKSSYLTQVNGLREQNEKLIAERERQQRAARKSVNQATLSAQQVRRESRLETQDSMRLLEDEKART